MESVDRKKNPQLPADFQLFGNVDFFAILRQYKHADLQTSPADLHVCKKPK